ncbi:MAG: hypothetical protein LBD45_05820 [Bacteroidales bacterium]|nr:hypothetical protein [Bacteroidales bacterium]
MPNHFHGVVEITNDACKGAINRALEQSRPKYRNKWGRNKWGRNKWGRDKSRPYDRHDWWIRGRKK